LRFQTALLGSLSIALCCFAQSGNTASDANALNRRIERRVRTTFQLPASIDVTVGKRVPSEIVGYDKVPVTLASANRSSKHDFLVSSDNKTIIEWEKLDISQDIDTTGRPERGNKDAKVTIVNYDDFECPFCSRMHQTLFPNLLKTYGNQVKIIYKDYPLVEIHPWAMHAAVNANCLVAQNSDAFWDFADYTHANQKAITGEKSTQADQYARLDQFTLDLGKKRNLDSAQLEACIKKQDETAVRASLAEGDKLGVDATPTMFVNGEVIAGILSETDLRAVIDRELREAGQTPPAPAPAPATSAEASPPKSASH
jgi:protein-disulfide isomerase